MNASCVQRSNHEAVDHFADQKDAVFRECWLICEGRVRAELGLGAGRNGARLLRVPNVALCSKEMENYF